MNNIPGMNEYVKKHRDALVVTEHCAKCVNCGLGWIEQLPYSEIITGNARVDDERSM